MEMGMDAEEHRARRLELEEELKALEGTWARTEPQVEYVERRVYKQMPPQIIKGPRQIVKEKVYVERSLGFFGRLGDRIDRFFHP
jgi:hypothetical protein